MFVILFTQKKRPFTVSLRIFLLPNQDSNPDRQNQNL